MSDHDHGSPFHDARWFGLPLKRREDPRLMTGSGTFIDDITPPRALHLAFVRSPYAHARVTSIDPSAEMITSAGGTPRRSWGP